MAEEYVNTGIFLHQCQLNIEAIWSTLTAVFKRRAKKPEPPAHRLFLATLYILPKLASGEVDLEPELPKVFHIWILAGCPLYFVGVDTKAFKGFYLVARLATIQSSFDSHVPFVLLLVPGFNRPHQLVHAPEGSLLVLTCLSAPNYPI